jgi:hypothetical protein
MYVDWKVPAELRLTMNDSVRCERQSHLRWHAVVRMGCQEQANKGHGGFDRDCL